MMHDMGDVVLPPELESFAAESVAAGRYRDRSAVVEAGVALLHRADAARADPLASVIAAEEEGDRLSYLTANELNARVETRLAQRTSPSG
jgi:putative addiction module CopG family antidote